MKKIQYKGAQTRLVDLTGQKFGKLTVIKRFIQNNNIFHDRYIILDYGKKNEKV